MDSKIYLVPCAIVLIISAILASTNARAVNKEERECNLLLKRLKRDAETNFIEDDDAFIENLIKTTLNKEKQKCMDKYHLLESPRQVTQPDDANDTKELRREVAKLKDLVNVIKDQRYILRTLENSSQNLPNVDAGHPKKTADHADEMMSGKELESLRAEIQKISSQLESSKSLKRAEKKLSSEDVHKIESSDRVKDKLETQQVEINNLKHLLQGVLLEMKASRIQVPTTTTESPRTKDNDMTQMLKELSMLEKKLSEMQHSTQQNTASNAEVVGMRPSLAQSSPTNSSRESLLRQSAGQMQARSAERAADEELDALLTLLAPEKSTTSVESLLKSLDADSDDELERRLLNLEKQVKHKKKQQLEEKLKNLEKQLTHDSGHSVQSKTDDIDVDSNAQLKRLLVKLLKKKHQQSESKSLDDDEVLDQLKLLQKSIKSLSTDDDDDLFEDLAEKNGNLDITLEKLINAGGSAGGSHRRRKLTPAQIKALRRRIMAMKNGSVGGGDDFDGAGHDFGLNAGDMESNLYSHANAGHGDSYSPHWHIAQGGYGPEEFGQYNHGQPGSGSKGDFSYGPNKYSNNFGSSEPFYGTAGGYIPSNQFGTPLYPNFENYHGSPVYSSYHHGSAGSSENSKYGNSPYGAGFSGFGSAYASRPPGLAYGSGSALRPGGSGSYAGASNYKQLFPAELETSAGAYNSQSNAGTPGATQSYQNQPSANAYGPASVADLKNQIYELQGIINTFNRPEYVQRPEDKATVYNLNNQINELKGVVNTLQESPYGGAPSAKGDVYQAAPVATYEAPAQAVEPSQQHFAHEVNEQSHPAPQVPFQPQSQPQPQAPGQYVAPIQAQHPPATRNYEGSYRKRRGIDVHAAINRNEEIINVLSAFLGEFLTAHDDHSTATDADPLPVNLGMQRAALNPNGPHIFDDVNAKIADVREQLDQQMFQRRLRQRGPNTPLAHLVPPNLRSNNDRYDNAGYYNYNGYTDIENYGVDTGKELKIKFKKDNKKADLFDKIFDKLIDKIIGKLEKAFPKILEVIFGKFEFTNNYQGDNGNYENNGYGTNNYGTQKYNQEGDGLVEAFRGMGLSGLLPMIIIKMLSKLLYIVQYLQRYKFFKTFLIPALILAVVAGAVVFLVWWLQPNEDTSYQQISYEKPYNTYHTDITNHQATPYEYYQESSPMRSVPLVQPRTNQNEFNRAQSSHFRNLNRVNEQKNVPTVPSIPGFAKQNRLIDFRP